MNRRSIKGEATPQPLWGEAASRGPDKKMASILEVILRTG